MSMHPPRGQRGLVANTCFLPRYFTQVHRIDPDSVWIDLCEGKDVSWLIRDFFVTYVKNSVREQPSLGPEEYEIVRGINSAVSIDCAWNTLIQAADTGILQRKRAEDPYNELRWSLKGRGRSHSTIARINMVSCLFLHSASILLTWTVDRGRASRHRPT